MGPEQAEPMTFTPAQLQDRTLHRRAIEAAIWGMPAVNYDAMYQALVRDAKGASNQIVYWSRLLDWKNQTLTPNPDAIYLMPFYDTTDGPMVLAIPPAEDGSITGSIDDAWQCAIADVGPAGVDEGKGGKCLILPPDYQGSVPEGYLPMLSPTFCGYALLRSNLKSGSQTDIAKAVAYGKRVKFYPLADADDEAPTTFVDAADVLFDATIPYDASFFEALDRRVQAEPWLTRDKAMIDTLRAIGIEKGRPFAPDTATQAALADALHEAHAWLDARYEKVFNAMFYDDARWALPASPELVEATTTGFSSPDSYPVDERGVAYSFAFFSAKQLGTAQFYLMTIKDKNGDPFDGAATYRLAVPPNVPVSLYWSATAYSRATHTLIRDMPWASRSSNTPGLHVDDDGSVILFFAPAPPNGRESNWVPTSKDGQFEVLCRFYGPEKSFFDKTWRLPDVERVH
jgi:hypothetical protein